MLENKSLSDMARTVSSAWIFTIVANSGINAQKNAAQRAPLVQGFLTLPYFALISKQSSTSQSRMYNLPPQMTGCGQLSLPLRLG